MEILSNAQVMNLVKSHNQIAVIVKLQFKQIIIAEIKLDICIGYKPFISEKQFEMYSSKLHIN